MRPIHIGISHDHNLVVTKLRNIKVISVSFGESTSECIDHGLDLRIGKHFVNGCFLHIQDLTSDRKDCLIITVAGSLCGTSRRISLYDKDLALGRILLLAVCQLSVRVKGIFLLCQKIRLRSLLCFTNLCCFLCAGKDGLKSLQISIKIEYHLLSYNLSGCA